MTNDMIPSSGTVFEESLLLHEANKGKLSVTSTIPLLNRKDLSLAYTPGVAEPCRKIAAKPEDIYRYTIKSHTVGVITDGSAVLGLGNIGAEAGLPVMEGKCALFKQFAGVDAFPICVKTQNPQEFIQVVKNIAPVFGGINLEDIAAPNCFIIEEQLKKELNIPVFHDDQHGTAIVVLAGLINAFTVANLKWSEAKVVILGAGAAGVAISKLLMLYGLKNVILCDRNGALHSHRADLQNLLIKKQLADITNPFQEHGSLAEVLRGANAFIGVSGPQLVTTDMIKNMASNAIVFAMANPTPEIMPEEAKAGGAFIIGTGRSDFPNQINNVLAFPGIFKGVLSIRAKQITEKMKLAAAEALAKLVPSPASDHIIPGVFEEGVADVVAQAVIDAA